MKSADPITPSALTAHTNSAASILDTAPGASACPTCCHRVPSPLAWAVNVVLPVRVSFSHTWLAVQANDTVLSSLPPPVLSHCRARPLPGVRASTTAAGDLACGTELRTSRPARAHGPVLSWRVTAVTTDSPTPSTSCR